MNSYMEFMKKVNGALSIVIVPEIEQGTNDNKV